MFRKNRSILYISFTFLIILCLIVLFCVFFIREDRVFRDNSENVGLITTYSSSQHVEIKNILPIADELGVIVNGKSVEAGSYGFLQFSIKNNNKKNTKYRVYIIKELNESFNISDRYIKFCLTDSNNILLDNYDIKNLPTYSDLFSLNDKPGARLIYSGTLDTNQEKEFILRSWLSDKYEITDDEESFSFDVFVEAK